jgi:hypothetical protein
VTEDPQSQSPAEDEPVTEDRPAVTADPATVQLPTASSETVTLPTQISEPTAVKTPAPTRPPIPPPVPPAVEAGPQPGPSPIERVTALVTERPEVGVGGAFAGGIVFALILKRLGR